MGLRKLLDAMTRMLTLAMLTAALSLSFSNPADRALASGTNYVAGIADLPLMPGLRAVPNAGVVFDKPVGRIVDAYAQGPVTPASVITFYRKALPQLGWEILDDASFRRESEVLRLEFLQSNKALTVRFALAPQ